MSKFKVLFDYLNCLLFIFSCLSEILFERYDVRDVGLKTLISENRSFVSLELPAPGTIGCHKLVGPFIGQLVDGQSVFRSVNLPQSTLATHLCKLGFTFDK